VATTLAVAVLNQTKFDPKLYNISINTGESRLSSVCVFKPSIKGTTTGQKYRNILFIPHFPLLRFRKECRIFL
jgi:hypothetical protein